MPYLRPYGVGTGSDIWIQHEVAASSALATSGDWTPGAGDVTVSKDGATAANIGTLPAYDSDALAWKYVFTAAELQCKSLIVSIRDATIKSDMFVVETTDHHSAQHANGVVWSGLGHASSQSTTNVRLGADPVITIRKGYFGLVTDGTGSGQAFYVHSYSTAGSAYNLTLALETPLFVALDDTSVIKLYVDRPGWLSAADVATAAWQGTSAGYDGITLKQLLEAIAAVVAGVGTGAGTTTETFANQSGTVLVTVTNNGTNRTATDFTT